MFEKNVPKNALKITDQNHATDHGNEKEEEEECHDRFRLTRNVYQKIYTKTIVGLKMDKLKDTFYMIIFVFVIRNDVFFCVVYFGGYF